MNMHEAKQADVSIAKMMHECAGEEGAVLLSSYAQTQPQSLPVGLDEKCRALIEKNFSRQQSKAVVNHIVRSVCVVLLCLCSLLGIGTVTVLSVEAIRVPVMQYVVSVTEKKLEFNGINPRPQEFVPETSVDLTDPLGQWLPDDYVISTYSGDGLDFYTAIYRNSQDHRIMLSSSSLNYLVVWDTEGAQICEQMEFCGHRAFLIVEDSRVSFVWTDEELGLSIGISTDQCSVEEVMDLAEQFIKKLKE